MSIRSWQKPILAGAALAGLVAIVAAAVSDLAGGAPGLGWKQGILMLAGFASLATAGSLLRSGRWSWSALTSTDLVPMLGVAVQLLLVGAVISTFQLESPAFSEKLVPLAVVGFLLHHLIGARFRLPFFFGLSCLGIVYVFGFESGAWLVALGIGLVAICHLPIAFAGRVALLLAAGTGLGLMRADLVPAPWSGAIWPILGSMFMFRLILYLYDLRTRKGPADPWGALSYFFLLPNVLFPLFPVVDYATFRRTYYDREAVEIYRKGIRWMLLGSIHLLAYRLIYQHAAISPDEVRSALDLGRYAGANYLLYLRVSGQFHMIVGILHLFGFRLPETHRFFFLASSFTDFWRRINVYWKDFMMKVFYYPAFFRLKRFGETPALVLSIGVVFAFNWLLHSYQWFWILGSWLMGWTDALFWVILGAVLAVNAVREAKRGRKRTLTARVPGWRDAFGLAARTVVFFTTMCLLWAFWTSPTVGSWVSMLTETRYPAAEVVLLVTLAFAAVLAIAAGHRIRGWAHAHPRVRERVALRQWRPAWAVMATCIVLLGLSEPNVTEALPPRLQQANRDLRGDGLNRQDAALLQRGYYENLTAVNRFNSRLWEVYAQRTDAIESIYTSSVARVVNEYHYLELRPLAKAVFRGAWFGTNRWGMRDRDYTRSKPDHTYRIALLGASYVAGTGVADGETFEAIVEDRLDAERGDGGVRIEILNFAVPDHSPLQQLRILETRAARFDADLTVFVAHPSDLGENYVHLAAMVNQEIEIPWPFVRDVVEKAGLDPETERPVGRRRLAPYAEELLSWTYRSMAERAEASRSRFAILLLPLPGEAVPPDAVAFVTATAAALGIPLVDLSDIYDGYDAILLQQAPSDHHPNVLGNRLIADRVDGALRKMEGFPSPVERRVVGTPPP